MIFWQKNGWWLPLVFVVALAIGLMAAETIGVQEAVSTAEPVLIIDPGHGGADGGAVAADGTLESDINLDIALRLEALAAFWGVETVMTRCTADIDYPLDARTLSAMKIADQKARLELINTTAGGVLLSIHQNNYPASGPNGPQVFYGSKPGGSSFASILQENMTGQLAPDNRRLAVAVDESIYLMKNAACTAVLVECGFLSNPDELQKLETGEYRLQMAAVFLASWLQYIRGITV